MLEVHHSQSSDLHSLESTLGCKKHGFVVPDNPAGEHSGSLIIFEAGPQKTKSRPVVRNGNGGENSRSSEKMRSSQIVWQAY